MTINQSELVKRVPKQFLTDKVVIPAYSWIKVFKRQNKALIQLNNSEMMYESIIDAELPDGFCIALENKFIKGLETRDIELKFEVDDKFCTIKYRGGKFKLALQDPDIFADPQKENLRKIADYTSLELLNALYKCSRISSNENYDIYSGVRFVCDGEKTCVEAADRQFAVSTRIIWECGKCAFDISNNQVSLLKEVLKDCESIQMFEADRVTMFKTESIEMYFNQVAINSETPYDLLIQKIKKQEYDKAIFNDVSYLSSQIRKSGFLIEKDEHRSLNILLEHNKWIIKTRDMFGDGLSEQEVEPKFSGKASTLNLNAQFFLRILNKLEDQVTINVPAVEGEVNRPIYIEEGRTSYVLNVLTY